MTTDTTNAGPAQGYSVGNASAPVKVAEFGDFECPQCGRFSTLTEPDLRKRLIETGEVFFTYYDFPIKELHKNTEAASNAAACADEQGKFWQMHDRLFDTQDQWNGEATNNPGKVFAGFATELGLNAPSVAELLRRQQISEAHQRQHGRGASPPRECDADAHSSGTSSTRAVSRSTS